MKSEHLPNPLQKELFAKVVDLLLDSPRRLTWKDAEMALAEALEFVYHESLPQENKVAQEKPFRRDEIIHKAIVKLMINNGWSRSVCVDLLSKVDLEDNNWKALAEVHHVKRSKVVVSGHYLPDGSVIILDWRYGTGE